MIRHGAAFALAIVLASAGTALAETRRGPVPAAPCAAAAAPVNYGRLLQAPDALKAEVEAYRQGWKEACVKKGGSSLAALLARGDRIAKAFTAVLDKSGIKETKFEELHEQFQNAYPRFIPAFHGSMIEYEYLEPDMQVYARQTALGDAEDKLFFASHRALYGTDAHSFPWVKRTWDHGGCVRFGEFDWTGAIARIETLEAKLAAAAYRTRLSELKDRVRRYLAEPAAKRDGKKPVVDSCAPRARTIAALEQTARGLAARKGWEPAAAGLRKTLDGIKAGQIEICNDCLR